VRDNPWLRPTKYNAAQDMVTTWEMISAETLSAGWDISKNELWDDDSELLYIIESTNS
jgi:hypothetical protein